MAHLTGCSFCFVLLIVGFFGALKIWFESPPLQWVHTAVLRRTLQKTPTYACLCVHPSRVSFDSSGRRCPAEPRNPREVKAAPFCAKPDLCKLFMGLHSVCLCCFKMEQPVGAGCAQRWIKVCAVWIVWTQS